MATHSNILAWRIPWTEEPGGLQSMGSQRVRHIEQLIHLLINITISFKFICWIFAYLSYYIFSSLSMDYTIHSVLHIYACVLLKSL